MRINGLDDLQKALDKVEKAMSELDGDIGSVSFDPEDPSSIELAIKQMGIMIDQRLGNLADNNMVAEIVDSAKEEFRSSILERAAQARLGKADD
jgi:hypothetical protein